MLQTPESRFSAARPILHALLPQLTCAAVMRLQARGDAELLEAKEALGAVEDIGARVVRDAGREAKKVGVELDELGPLVVALAP